MSEGKLAEKTDLDRLIDWYEQFNPERGKRIPVSLSAAGLADLFDRERVPGEEFPTEIEYRGRIVYATKDVK